MDIERDPVRVWDLLDDYLDSAAHRRLAVSTRREYARVAAHVSKDIGHVATAEIDRRWLRGVRDRWARAGHRAASLRLQVLKNAIQPLIDDDALTSGLFDRLNRVRAAGPAIEPHPVWKEAEFAAVVRSAGHLPGLVRALGLARYAGLRREDLCRIPNSARIREDGRARLAWKTGKGEVAVNHLEDARLTRLLDKETPERGWSVAYNRKGEPWAPRQLSQALQRVLARAEAKGLVRRGLTWHGLRHSRGVELAEAGCSDAIIMAQLGHTTDRSAQIYRRQANRRTLGDVGQALVDAKLGANQHLIPGMEFSGG